MAKNGVYGIKSFSFADCVANGGYPTSFTNSIKAIVTASLTFNDQAAQTSDVEIEDSEDPYAVLPSSAATKGFTVQTYDLSKENFESLLGYTVDESKWENEAPVNHDIRR